MYKDYFGFIELPFSIVPSARYLFLSSRHREAMGHLQAGLGEGGGFAMLTGEVGTGKTTVSKAMLASLNDNVKAGLILNPTFSDSDLLEAICDEFEIEYPDNASLKQLTKGIYHYLMANHSQGIQTLLLIDEAQHLSAQVLEQLRLLTNLETDSQKLLKVLLVGQPELQQKLQTAELRQLAQRITGRYHLLPLGEKEVEQYIQFRLRIAGSPVEYFSSKAVKIIAQTTKGVPRLINLVCDKALLYTFYSGEKEVSASQAEKACQDVMSFQAPMVAAPTMEKKRSGSPLLVTFLVSALLSGGIYHFKTDISRLIQSQLAPLPVVQLDEKTADNTTEPVLASFLNQSQSSVDAMQVLYELWGVRASVLNSNCLADNSPYQCDTGVADWQHIVSANQPVILPLSEEDSLSYVVLYAINDEYAELLNKNQRIQVPIWWLKERWNGGYQGLWYSEVDQVLKRNSRGNQVLLLDSLLSTALNEPANDSVLFDASLERKVRAFQQWQGLDADGVVGRNTLKILAKLTNTSAPTLHRIEVKETK